MAGEKFTILYVDGQPVNKIEHGEMGIEGHTVQDTNSFIVGQYDVGQYAFYGNISRVAVLHSIMASTEGEVRTFSPFFCYTYHY